MNILFRTDAGGKIGLGHYYRTLHLAETLMLQGHGITMVHRASNFWSKQATIPSEINLIEMGSTEPEEAILARICEEQNIDILYVDLIIDYNEFAFRKIKEKVTVVFYQNLSSSRHLADIYILPSLHQQSEFFGEFDEHTKVYQGLEYSIFNKEIASTNSKTAADLEEVSSVSIITGGSDPENVLLKIYTLLRHVDYKNIRFNYHIGASFIFPETIPNKSDLLPNVAFIPYNPEVINNSQIVIAAFGVSVYELMSIGMPLICVGHQLSNAVALHHLSKVTLALQDLGLINELKSEDLNKEVTELIHNKSSRLRISEAAKNSIDQNGVRRVIEILNNIKPKIS